MKLGLIAREFVYSGAFALVAGLTLVVYGLPFWPLPFSKDYLWAGVAVASLISWCVWEHFYRKAGKGGAYYPGLMLSAMVFFPAAAGGIAYTGIGPQFLLYGLLALFFFAFVCWIREHYAQHYLLPYVVLFIVTVALNIWMHTEPVSVKSVVIAGLVLVGSFVVCLVYLAFAKVAEMAKQW